MEIFFLIALLAAPFVLLGGLVTFISCLISLRSPPEERRGAQHELLVFSSVLTVYVILLAVLYFLI